MDADFGATRFPEATIVVEAAAISLREGNVDRFLVFADSAGGDAAEDGGKSGYGAQWTGARL